MSLWLWIAVGAVLLSIIQFLTARLRRPSFSVAGLHVLVTGGSQGLGKAFAELCCRKGARVTIVARTAAKLEETAQDIRSRVSGAEIQHLSVDVAAARTKDFLGMLEQAARSFGRVDVVVSNAGTGIAKLLLQSAPEELDELLESQMALNLQGTLRCAIASAQRLASDGRGGRVCIVSSACGLLSMPGYAIYSSTKYGQRGFVHGAYHEFRRHGVHLSIYFPGSMQTPGFEKELEVVPLVTGKIEAQCSDIATPESAAQALLSGLEGGAMEITNEAFPQLLIETPTGCVLLDAIIGGVISLARLGWSLFIQFMTNSYLQPRSSEAASGPSAASSSGKKD